MSEDTKCWNCHDTGKVYVRADDDQISSGGGSSVEVICACQLEKIKKILKEHEGKEK